MPARQRGSVEKLATCWGVRFVDESGRRRRQGGFATKTEARAWLDARVAEVEALRRGESHETAQANLTVDEAISRYLAQHDVDMATTKKLTRQLRHAEAVFGGRLLRSLRADELGAWRRSLPEGSRHDVFRAFKQVLGQAARWGWIDTNPAEFVKNPKPQRAEIDPFESWDQIFAISAEMDPRFGIIPVFATGTGLRPEEWIALERKDIDRTAGVVVVERVYTQGVLKQCAKTSRQRRRVPVRTCVLEALDAQPVYVDSPLLFPSARGRYIDLERFREREWKPALRAAGVDHRRIYDMRHTFATWAIRAEVSLFYLSRIMGTSIAEIDNTYGHLVPDRRTTCAGCLIGTTESWLRAVTASKRARDQLGRIGCESRVAWARR
jgi:integrase